MFWLRKTRTNVWHNIWMTPVIFLQHIFNHNKFFSATHFSTILHEGNFTGSLCLNINFKVSHCLRKAHSTNFNKSIFWKLSNIIPILWYLTKAFKITSYDINFLSPQYFTWATIILILGIYDLLRRIFLMCIANKFT